MVWLVIGLWWLSLAGAFVFGAWWWESCNQRDLAREHALKMEQRPWS